MIVEPFLDSVNIQNVTGLAFGVNFPTKDAANSPLLEPAGANGATYDYQKLYCSMVWDDPVWRLFYGAAVNGAGNDDDRGFMATSTDGVTFTKPNLGNVTIAGNTNNACIFDYRLTSCRYDAELDLWLATAERFNDDVLNKIFIFTSPSPGTGWSLVKTLSPGTHIEGKDLLRREDGRWLVYYSAGHATDTRAVCAYLSDTTDLAGAWTDLGPLITAGSAGAQRYSIGVERFGDIHYGIAMRYNEPAANTIIDLYVSRDGQAWTLKQSNWIPLGSGGAFDDELIFGGNRLAAVGDTWWIYYTGSPVDHDAGRPKDMRIGRASIPKGRIGKLSGTGTITTALLEPDGGSGLVVNCNGTGGSVVVEVLDAGGTPLVGFAAADFTPITTDQMAFEPLWAGGKMPSGDSIRLKFTVTSATLYGYEIDALYPVVNSVLAYTVDGQEFVVTL